MDSTRIKRRLFHSEIRDVVPKFHPTICKIKINYPWIPNPSRKSKSQLKTKGFKSKIMTADTIIQSLLDQGRTKTLIWRNKENDD
ncbi:hypothetical protein YC2023_005205 [Brassica napus]